MKKCLIILDTYLHQKRYFKQIDKKLNRLIVQLQIHTIMKLKNVIIFTMFILS